MVRWRDGSNDFGWLSILLHWLSAAAVLSLLFIGDSIHSAHVDSDSALRTHTTLALTAYILLWLRVIWRVRNKHPGPLPGQRKFFYTIAKPFHYLLVLSLAVMLITGPVMAWTGALPLRFGNIEIPSPLPVDVEWFASLHAMHATAAKVLGWGTLLHVLAVIVHAAIHRDGAFDRMLAPRSRVDAS